MKKNAGNPVNELENAREARGSGERPAEPELDALVAENVMGENLKPHRDVAMVAVGWRYISCTGPTFSLRNGREVPMPNGDTLRSPEGSTNWNDRYALRVAEVLGDEIAAEVEAFRSKPAPYSTDIAIAWQVVEKMRETRNAAFVLGANGCTRQFSAWFNDGIWALAKPQNSCPEFDDPKCLGAATAHTAPRAICLAALYVVGEERSGARRDPADNDEDSGSFRQHPGNSTKSST